MTWATIYWIFIGIWTTTGITWWLMSCFLVSRALTRSTARLPGNTRSDDPMPVSVFKSLPPLKGLPPSPWLLTSLQQLAGALSTEDQLILGSRPEDEPLWQEHLITSLSSPAPTDLVVVHLNEDVFHNRKVVALNQLAAKAEHALWFWSDADIRLPEGGWQRMKQEWRQTPCQALTFPYRLVHSHSPWGDLEALYVNAEFLPGVQAARALATHGTVSFSLGAGILFRGSDVMTTENWDDLSRDLADDFRLGQQLKEVTISSHTLLETESAERSLTGALNHYLRWHKTVRWSQPGGYFAQIALLPMLGWLISLLIFPGWPSLIGLLLIWLIDTLAALWLMKQSGGPQPCPGRLLALWPLLRALVWLAVWIPWPVAWRGNLWWHRRRNTATYQIMTESSPQPVTEP